MASFLDFALWYHSQEISVVPVKPRDKAVALPTWEEYQHRQSTPEEISRWWGRNPNLNIGLVHGVNGYAALDIDHDDGVFAELKEHFPAMFTGAIEQSGSGRGYHVPMFLQDYPDLGQDSSRNRPKGNKTWHTERGDVNIRARWCQTVAPPSVHPSGGRYKFIQKAAPVHLDNLNSLIAYLNLIAPQPVLLPIKKEHLKSISSPTPAIAELKAFYPSIVDVFQSLGVTGEIQRERSGEVRILGHGGLVIDEECGVWYSFCEEMGGDVIDAWGFAKWGAAWTRRGRQFAEVVGEMKYRAGIGTVRELPAHAARSSGAKSGYWK